MSVSKEAEVDWNRTLDAMSDCRFVIDVSFLGLLRSQMQRAACTEHDVATDSYERDLRKAIDDVFRVIVGRNFRRCTLDERYFIFSHNEYDALIDLREAQAFAKGTDQQDAARQEAAGEQEVNPYLRNFESSTDAFQESEKYDIRLVMAHKNGHRAQTVQSRPQQATTGAVKRDQS